MARGTTPTQVRLTDDDKEKIQVIKERHNLPSLAAALRYAVEVAYRTGRRNSGKKSGDRT